MRADRNEYVDHEVSAFLKTGGRTRYGEQGLFIVLFLIVAVFWLEQLPPRSVNVKGAVAGPSQFHPIPEEQYGRRLRVDTSSARKEKVKKWYMLPKNSYTSRFGWMNNSLMSLNSSPRIDNHDLIHES